MWPGTCATCGSTDAAMQSGGPLCGACGARFGQIPRETCALCQSRAPAASGSLCASCAGGETPLEACVAEVYYAGEVERWLRRFKYPPAGLLGLDPAPAALACAWVCAAVTRLSPRLANPVAVVPVPSHPARIRRRGFAPALGLARAAACHAGARLLTRALRTTRSIPSQTGLDRAARRHNVADAFRTRSDLTPFASVLLIDDVVTTGATLTEAARVLRAAGARQVLAAAAARTPLAFDRGPR